MKAGRTSFPGRLEQSKWKDETKCMAKIKKDTYHGHKKKAREAIQVAKKGHGCGELR